jgi:hypothetical protein
LRDNKINEQSYRYADDNVATSIGLYNGHHFNISKTGGEPKEAGVEELISKVRFSCESCQHQELTIFQSTTS